MSIRKRSVVVGIILCFFLILYAAAKLNSYILVEYVVERTLVQKSPGGVEPADVRRRFRELMAKVPDKRGRTELLFQISRELEKVQTLSPPAFEEILSPERLKTLK
jgi:hypothetical protein